MAVSQLQKLCAFGISGTFAAALTATSALTATPTRSSAPDLPASQSSAGVTVTQAHIDKGRLVVIGTSRFGTRCEDGQFEACTD